jgi:hypothetical protein
MTRTTLRPVRKQKASRSGQSRAAVVFRDFVRQLEKLDGKPVKNVRGGER